MNNTVIQHGQIKAITLPKEFSEIPRSVETSWNSTMVARMFVSSEHPEVKVIFYYRGQPLAEPLATAFKQELSLPAHDLDSNQLKQLERLFFQQSSPDDFDLELARTENLNGKRVIHLVGTWLDADIYDSSIFFAKGAENGDIEEVHLICPKAEHAKYSATFEQILKSIEWV